MTTTPANAATATTTTAPVTANSAVKASTTTNPARAPAAKTPPAAHGQTTPPAENNAPPAAPKRLRLLDTTLRDGAQAAGVCFSRKQRVTLARALTAAGVAIIEAGIPASGRAAAGDISAVADAVSPARVLAWCRALERDLDAAAGTAAGHVHLSLPVSEIHLAAWGHDRAWALRTLAPLVAAARQRFATVGVGAQDASRADPAFLREFAVAARAAGADRLRLADTAGVWTPAAAAATVADLAPCAPPLEIHAHNDLGLATAVTLAAAAAGAPWADVTINGLGERAGNAPLEEVAVAWRIAHAGEILTAGATGDGTGGDTAGGTGGSDFDYAALTALSALAARFSRRHVPPSKPIVGDAVFTHASGVHCAGQLRDRRAYEPFPPELVGRAAPAFEIGAATGAAAIATALSRPGVPFPPARARALLAPVRALARRLRRPLTPRELRKVAATESASL
ncbi:MAG: hypothetical protein LBR07_03760 [Puniceicoccales bacterium]|nr:hypothetical protein [Puniceicoccales bacterium]